MNKAILLTSAIFAYAIYKWVKYYKQQKMLKSFQDKVVWITGASSGLGRSLAIKLYQLGAKLILSARREQELEKTRTMCLDSILVEDKTLYNPMVFPIDLDEIDKIQDKVKEIEKKYGRIDILIHSAGQGTRTSFVDSSFEVHHTVMNTNYFGPLKLTHAILPLMIRQENGGNIVFVSSVQGLMGIDNRSPYSASKHAMIGLADTLNIELSFNNIHVLDVCPGYIKTDHSRNALTSNGSRYGSQDETTEKGYSPEYVADKMIYSIYNNDNELIIADLKTRAAMFFRYMLPDVYFFIMKKRALKHMKQQ